MLGKRPRPMIGKLSELLVSRGREVTLPDAATATATAGSPRTPSGTVMQSPRGFKNYHLGGVGLGIVVALDKPSTEVLPKHAVCTSNLKIQEEFDVEEYTYVTRHVPNQTFTKVYYDGGEGEIQRHDYSNKTNNNNIININNHNNLGVFRRTAPQPLFESESSYPTSNFLSSCNLCGKKLHGKDIYMYRYIRASSRQNFG